MTDITPVSDNFAELAERVQSFIDAWETTASPPSLSDYLPTSGEQRELCLLELIKVDLEFRYRALQSAVSDPSTPTAKIGDPVHSDWCIEQYLVQFPELGGRDRVPAELIYEEHHVRRQSGLVVTMAELAEKFPSQANRLRRLIDLNQPSVSTALAPLGRLDLKAGDSLGDFDLVLPLGRGAFGQVFLARQSSMQRLVAVKITANRGREPQTMAQLDHPNIVRVYDQQSLPDKPLRLLYMQYVPGGTLADLVQRVKSVPQEERSGTIIKQTIESVLEKAGQSAGEALRQWQSLPWSVAVCRIGAQLAEALDYAHQRGTLHRDVKPANVLMSADGLPKLADFNISFSNKIEGVSHASSFGGSLPYMSTEQLEAFNPEHSRQPGELDARADLFSLGVLLWELLYGERPWQAGQSGRSLAELTELRYQRKPQGSQPLDDCEAALQAVLLRCLAANRSGRFETGAQLARQLKLCEHPEAIQLLDLGGASWKRTALRWPLFILGLCALVPNAFAAWFNLIYNMEEIVDKYRDSADAFWNIQAIINLVSFPIGLALCIYLAWPVGAAAQRQRDATDDLVDLRERSLCLGHWIAVIGVSFWTVAGLTYPIALSFVVQLTGGDYFHFLASLVICGLIAASYPFFLISQLSLRVLFPAFVEDAQFDERDEQSLSRLANRLPYYLFLAGAVPAIGILAVMITGSGSNSQSRLALFTLSGSGAVGFAFIFWLYQSLRRAINTLLRCLATSPAGVVRGV